MMNVDPMDALNGFQTALNSNSVKVQAGSINKNIMVHLDYPDGSTPRFTYVLAEKTGGLLRKKTKVKSAVVIVLDKPHKGLPCFHVSYATAVDERGKGLATGLLKDAIKELHSGFSRNGRDKLYIEAVVDADNVVSQKVADKVLVGEKVARNDAFGSKVFHYMKLFE